jgi:hypothetical protein
MYIITASAFLPMIYISGFLYGLLRRLIRASALNTGALVLHKVPGGAFAAFRAADKEWILIIDPCVIL